MLVVPTWVVENSYVPLPWVVCHSIFGLFALEDWQIDLHSKTPSWPCWVVASSGTHHDWLLGTLIASPIWTIIPRRGWTTRSVSRKLWSSLSSAPRTTLTSTLRTNIFLIRPVINCITTSHFQYGNTFFYAPHPLFNVLCNSGGPQDLHHSIGMSWTPSLSFLFHNSIQDGLVALLCSIYLHLYLSCPTCPIDGAHQAESDIPGVSWGKPFLEWSSSKE